MNLYNRNGPCVKCGERHASSHYQAAVSGWVAGPAHAKQYGPLGPDQITRKCLNCGYVWNERPLS